jgi:RHS repeat-associated protein
VSEELLEYYPFGRFKTGGPTSSTTHIFTGHERDSGTSLSELDYMHARYYSPLLGRFLSVDPIQGGVGSSQSWNRHSYVRNNPLRRIDPSGMTDTETRNFVATFHDQITVTAKDPLPRITTHKARLVMLSIMGGGPRPGEIIVEPSAAFSLTIPTIQKYNFFGFKIPLPSSTSIELTPTPDSLVLSGKSEPGIGLGLAASASVPLANSATGDQQLGISYSVNGVGASASTDFEGLNASLDVGVGLECSCSMSGAIGGVSLQQTHFTIENPTFGGLATAAGEGIREWGEEMQQRRIEAVGPVLAIGAK